MKVLGVILARGGSVGVKRKNLRDLGGVPLVAHTIKSAAASSLLTEFCVSTEDPEIASVSKHFGAPVPFVRPIHLAPDVKSELVVQHALDEYKKVGEIFDAVMMLQPTSPFRSSGTIDKAIEMLIKSGGKYTSVMTAQSIEGHRPEWMFKDVDGIAYPYVTELNGMKRDSLELVARQDLEELHRPDGNIFLADVKEFERTGNMVTSKCGFFLTESIETFDIDTELDLKIANALIGSL
jgi:CMP-N,N'-diacetyllegionaminic acid synthase